MCKFNPKNDSRRIDPCLRPLIRFLKDEGYIPVACCCGHGKYPMTIIIRIGRTDHPDCSYIEILSDRVIPRKKRFYLKDKQGYYYIPELN